MTPTVIYPDVHQLEPGPGCQDPGEEDIVQAEGGSGHTQTLCVSSPGERGCLLATIHNVLGRVTHGAKWVWWVPERTETVELGKLFSFNIFLGLHLLCEEVGKACIVIPAPLLSGLTPPLFSWKE